MSLINPKIKKIIFFDILLFLLGIAGIYHIIERAGFNPNDALNITLSEKGKLVIANIYNSEIDNLFQVGDTILAVNIYPVASIDEIEMIFDSHQIGSPVVLLISRSGTPFTKTVTLPAFYSLSYILIALFVGCAFFFLGFFVLLRRPDEPAAIIFHWVSVFTAIIIMTTWGRYTIQPMGLGFLVRVLFCAGYAFTPVLFFHFSLIYPKLKWKVYKKILILLYTFASILWLWNSVTFFNSVLPLPSIENIHLFLFGFDTNRLFFALCIVLGVVNFLHSFFVSIDNAEKRKILWIIIGMLGPLGFVFLWQLPQLLNYESLFPEEIIILLAAMMPVAFTISIIRHHILDIYLIINRSTVYVIVATLLLTLYAMMIGLAMALIESFTTQSSIITSAIAAIILALLFEPLRKKVQILIDKKFFRVRYNYRIAQRKFTDEINQSFDLKSLTVFTVNKLDDIFQPTCIGFLLKNENNTSMELLAHKNCETIEDTIIQNVEMTINHSSHPLYSFPDQLEPGIPFFKLEFEQLGNIALILPIRKQNGAFIGMLFLGKKQSDTTYSLEDIDLLKTIIAQLGLSIERIQLQNKLFLKQEEAIKLDDLNKMQSFFISSISHDLQTPLTGIQLYIDLMKSKKNLSAEKKKEYLGTISGESERLSKLINNVLDVSRIERGVKKYQFKNFNLNVLIEIVVNSMQYQLSQQGFEVRLVLPANKITIEGDEDSLDRAITNLISNAIKYSTKKKFLSVKLFTKDSQAAVEITDKGVGIPKADQQKIFDIFYRSEDEHIQTISGAGLGLTIVDHVVRAHRGKIEVDSTPGLGSRFTLWLPFKQIEGES